jgi:hypothetical protein
MTEQPQYAGDLTYEETERCESIAWRLVHAEILGKYGGEDEAGFSNSDAGELWHVARNDIRNEAEVEAVLEILGGIIGMAMVDKDGHDNALRKVREEIAKTDGTWPEVAR